MRYSPAHKQQSRARILEAARVLFRARGLDGASIHDVMQGAGLTRGAFYAHFADREALVAAVLELEPGLVGAVRDAPGPTAAIEVIAGYLDPSQREDVASNCAFVAHAADVRRGPHARRQAYEARLEALVTALRESGLGPDAAQRVAVLAIGGALLSAAVATPACADAIQAVAADAVRRELG